MLSKRQIELLKVIIDDFVENATPVASKSLQATYQLPYSSATIRTEMAYLEEVGLLEKTHTSSGRVPSNQGYRYYVDYLVDKHDVDEQVKLQLNELFNNRRYELDEVIKKSCELISDMTNYTSVALDYENEETLQKIQFVPINETSAIVIMVTQNGRVENKMFNVESGINLEEVVKCVDLMNEMLIGTKLDQLVDRLTNEIKPILADYVLSYEYLFEAFINAFMNFSKERMYVSGKNNVINEPEFNDVNKVRQLVSIMEDNRLFKQLVSNNDELGITIGNENEIVLIDDLSVITKQYHISDSEKGVIAIIGPTRMHYDKVINLLEYVSHNIELMIEDKKGGK